MLKRLSYSEKLLNDISANNEAIKFIENIELKTDEILN